MSDTATSNDIIAFSSDGNDAPASAELAPLASSSRARQLET